MNQTRKLLLLSLASAFLFSWCAVSLAQARDNDEIIEAAKSEGNVSFYTTMSLSQSKKVVDKFQQKYPFIKPELFRGGGDEVLNRILNEARGGLYAWDVVSTRGDSVLTLMDSKLITSYRSPENKFISADLVDDEGYWTAYYVNPYVLGYNTNLVKKERCSQNLRRASTSSGKGERSPSRTQLMVCWRGTSAAWGKEQAVDLV